MKITFLYKFADQTLVKYSFIMSIMVVSYIKQKGQLIWFSMAGYQDEENFYENTFSQRFLLGKSGESKLIPVRMKKKKRGKIHKWRIIHRFSQMFARI